MTPKKLVKGKILKASTPIRRKYNFRNAEEIKRDAKKKIQDWESMDNKQIRLQSQMLLQQLNDRETFLSRAESEDISPSLSSSVESACSFIQSHARVFLK